MDDSWHRVVGHQLRVADNDVLVTIFERHDEHGQVVHTRVVGPNQLITEGPPAAAWREMLELLGIAPPAPPAPLIAKAPEPEKASPDPLPEPAAEEPAGSTTILPPMIAASPPQIALPPAIEAESRQSLPEDKEDEDIEREQDRPVRQGSFRQTFRDTLLRILNSPVEPAEDESDAENNDEPPCEVTRKDVAYIPKLATAGEAARFIYEIDRNIELLEMRADASARAKRLAYLKKANRAKRCQHMKLNGEGCGSPALRRQKFCHFHAQTHAPGIDIPVIEDQRSLQLALTKVAQQVAGNKIDAVQAKLLLQILDIAGRNLPAEGC